MVKSLLSSLVFLLIATSAWASGPSMIISDVDDTVRAMNVWDRWDMIGRAMRTDNDFSGMAQLYQVWKASPRARQTRLSGFVTGGSENFSGVYQRFFDATHFPLDFITYKKGSQDTLDYKVQAIQQLIAQNHPVELVLFGDNTEKDPQVYLKIRQQFPEIKTHEYIHQLYSGQKTAPVENGQVKFLTAADLAIQLYNVDEIGAQDLQAVLNEVNADAFSKDRNKRLRVVDTYFDCTDFFTQNKWPQAKDADAALTDITAKLEGQVRKLCQHKSDDGSDE